MLLSLPTVTKSTVLVQRPISNSLMSFSCDFNRETISDSLAFFASFAPLFFPYFRRNACAPASPARRFGTSPRNRRSGTSEKSGSGRPPRRSRRMSPLTAPTAVRSMPSRPPRHIAVPVRSAPDRQGSHATWPDNRGSSRLWHAER